MPINYKILGQAATSVNNSNTVLYTVPANTQAIISSILLHRIDGNQISLWIVKSGESAAVKSRILNAMSTEWDAANNFVLNLGITLSAGDRIIAGQGNTSGNVSCHVFGIEIS